MRRCGTPGMTIVPAGPRCVSTMRVSKTLAHISMEPYRTDSRTCGWVRRLHCSISVSPCDSAAQGGAGAANWYDIGHASRKKDSRFCPCGSMGWRSGVESGTIAQPHAAEVSISAQQQRLPQHIISLLPKAYDQSACAAWLSSIKHRRMAARKFTRLERNPTEQWMGSIQVSSSSGHLSW